jgi:hypothetical protein
MKLDFEQRQRAEELISDLNESDAAERAAPQIIGMRDIIATIVDMLSPMVHPETKKPIGFHMCFVRDADLPLLREIAAKGVVRRASNGEGKHG